VNSSGWLEPLRTRRWSRRSVTTFGALFIVAVIALATYDIFRGYRETVSNTGRELDSQARVIAEQTARSVQAIDVVLRHLAEQFQSGGLGALSREDLHRVLRDKSVGLVQADGLVFINPDGTVRAISLVAPDQQPPINLSGDPPFEMLRSSSSTGLLIADAMRSPGTGRWVIPMGRRLSTPSGGFAGAITALGKVDYFQQFYRDAYPDPASQAALLHRNTTLLARHPRADDALGHRFPQLDTLLQPDATGKHVIRSVSPLDGVDRFGAARLVPDYPLAVIVTRDASAVFAPWREQALGSALRTLALAALAAWLMALMLRQLGRLDAARASLEVSQERYALAAAGSDDGIWDWDLAAGVGYESRRARELQGLPLEPETQPLTELQGLLTYHPDDAPLRREAMQAHLDGKTPAYEIEYRVRQHDGQYRWIRVRALCIRDADGKPLRIAGSVSDVDARKRAEVALRESEQRFAVAVAGSDDGIWEWDYVHGRAFASPRGREILGLPPGPDVQSIDEWFEQMEKQLHPDDLARRTAALEDHLHGGAPAYEGEFRVRTPGGGYRWIRVHGMCSRDAQGRPLRIAGSVSDVDARKRAEEALRQSEERYALAMTGLRGGHWVWEADTGALFVSGPLNELYGLPADLVPNTREAYFKSIDIHPDDLHRVLEGNRALAEGRAERGEWEYRILPRDGGAPRWVATRAQRFLDGQAVRVAGVTVDATERKRTEEALRASEERFALAVAGSNDGIVDWDLVGDRIFTSQRALQIVGATTELETHTSAEWLSILQLHPEDQARHDEDFRRHLRGETELRDRDYRMRHPDGSYRWVRVRGKLVRDAKGRAVRWAGSISDIDAQKRTEEALRESEERFALALAGANDGILDWDIVRDRFFASERALRMFGLEPDNVVRTRAEWAARVLPRFHPDDRQRLRDELRGDADHPATSHEGEYRLLDAQGVYRWMRFRGRSVRDASGRAIRWAGSVSDIDASRRTQEALRQSEERYAFAMTGSHEGHWVWDMDAKQVFVSDALADMFGLPGGAQMLAEEEYFRRIPLHPEDAARVHHNRNEHLAGRTPRLDHEFRIVRPESGEVRWFHTRGQCFRDAQGRPERMAGATVDITDRKRVDDALRKSEERYQLAVDGSNEGLWDWDLASDMLFLSPRAQQLTFAELGEPLRPRREWIERTSYHPDDMAHVRQVIADHLRGVTPHFTVEYRLRHHSGAWHWYRQRGIAVRDERGRAYRMAGSMEDITERKNAEAERDRLEQQLRQAQKLEAIGTLAGGIAHDFNNILAAILGYGELAQKDAAEGTALRRHVDAALAAGTRAKSLVERILAFSRSGMGERVPVHVGSVVAEALDGVAASLPAGVRLERRLQGGDAGVQGDPTQIHQVVMNLCANAVQAMRGCGELEVAVSVQPFDAPRLVATSTLPAGDYLLLTVRDTGVGIEPRLLERIFDPFFTTKEVGVGTGLGLSLVHGIVTDLGGGIAVESRLGEGTVFSVYLPSIGTVAAPVAPAAEEAAPPGSGETILLVDDEEALVRLGEETLAELGYEPVGFVSSTAALEALRAAPERFDAVLSDEAMPGLTGTELAAEIRALRPDMPIVLMSGFVSPAMLVRAREAGVADVLGKPLAAREIARCLANALGRRLHAEPS
jgi:PAS domain S-box-containing protein